MKKLLFMTGLVAAFLLGIESLQAASADELFSKVKVSLSSSNPPSTSTSRSTPSTTSSWRNRWLIITVEYTPALQDRQRHFWIDDATLDIRAVFNGQVDGQPWPIMFTGRSTFWTVPLDGRRHIATMMVPPQLLDRYLPASGSASTVSLGSTFTVEAAFRDRAGTLLGIGYLGRNLSNEKYAEFFAGQNSGTAQIVNGSILPRFRTPWALQDVDSFDLLRQEDREVSIK